MDSTRQPFRSRPLRLPTKPIVQNSGTGTNTLTLNTKGNINLQRQHHGNINLTIAGTGTANSFRLQQLHRQHPHQ